MKLKRYKMDIPGLRLICVAKNMIEARRVFEAMAVGQGAPASIVIGRTIVPWPLKV